MAGLLDLPAELLYQIHLEAESEQLPVVCHHLQLVFSLSSPTHKAAYLLQRHPHSTLAKAVKYGVCSLPVIKALERISLKPLRCSELPRRLVKNLRGTEDGLNGSPGASGDPVGAVGGGQVDLVLIEYLLEKYAASANSKGGYFLARAVLAKHLPLIDLLLSYDADPGLKKGYAVILAIGHGDLNLVTHLIEPRGPVVTGPASQEDDLQYLVLSDNGVEGKKSGKRRKSSESGAKKRPKMDRRCEATAEMLEAAVKRQHWNIVDYLRAQGAPPSLEALQMLW